MDALCNEEECSLSDMNVSARRDSASKEQKQKTVWQVQHTRDANVIT